MDRYLYAIRRRLGDLQRLRGRTDAADGKIGEAASSMLEHAEQDIAKLRPRVHLDESAAGRYLERVRDRGLLQRLTR